jgi:nitrate reductase NapE
VDRVLREQSVQPVGNDYLWRATAVDDADKKLETRSFLLLVVVLAPVLAVAIVGGYGFLVWFSQMFFGPPGV